MPDPQAPAADPAAATDAKPDLTNYVPKEEYEKMSSDFTNLKSDLDKLRVQLLDPDYVEYKEAKKAPPKAPSTSPETPFGNYTQEEIDKMPASRVLKLAEENLGKRVASELQESYNKDLQGLKTAIGNISAELELRKVMDVHPDFNEYRDDVAKILETSPTELTIEQAYELAKGRRPAEPGKTPEPPKGSEKPTGAPPDNSMQKTEYKSDEEASKAALESIRERYKISGDTL